MRRLPLCMVLALGVTIAIGAVVGTAGDDESSSAAPPTTSPPTTAAPAPAGPRAMACGPAGEMISLHLTPGSDSVVSYATPTEAAAALIAERRVDAGREPLGQTYRDGNGAEVAATGDSPEARAAAARAVYWKGSYGTARRAGVTLEVRAERAGAGWSASGLIGCMDVLGGYYAETVDP